MFLNKPKSQIQNRRGEAWRWVKEWVQVGWRTIARRVENYRHIYTIVDWNTTTHDEPIYDWRMIQTGLRWKTTGYRKTYKTVLVPAVRRETYQKAIYGTITEVVGEDKVVNINPTASRATLLALAAANLSRAKNWLRGGHNRTLKFVHRGVLYTATIGAALLLLLSQCSGGGGGGPSTPTAVHLPTLTPTAVATSGLPACTPTPTPIGSFGTPTPTPSPPVTLVSNHQSLNLQISHNHKCKLKTAEVSKRVFIYQVTAII